METIRFSAKLDLDYIQFTKVTPFPNTELYRMLIQDGFYDYWKEFTLDPSREREIPLVRTGLSPREAITFVKKAYLYFYFRPSYLLNAAIRVKSLFELKNNIVAAAGLIFNAQ